MGEISCSKTLAVHLARYQDFGSSTQNAERIHDGLCDAEALSFELPAEIEE
jgi:hypothetical protein